MFYWNYKDIFVVLSYEEMMALVNDLSKGNTHDLLGFNMNKQTRKNESGTVSHVSILTKE